MRPTMDCYQLQLVLHHLNLVEKRLFAEKYYDAAYEVSLYAKALKEKEDTIPPPDEPNNR